MIPGIVLLTLFVIAGLWLAGSLFAQRRILTWLSTGVGLAWGVFLAVTAVTRALALQGQAKFLVLYVVVVALLLAGFFVRDNFRWPRGGWRDVWVLVVLIPVLVSVLVISAFNGRVEDGSLVLHSFYNGDVTTFVSLVQKSLLTPGWVTDNPFAVGLPLEYPTLLHSAVAEVVSLFGGGLAWIYFLPLMSLLTAFVTAPLFFLFMDVVQPEPAEEEETWFGVRRRGWVYAAQALVVAYVLGMAWDNYVYPQSHFFLLGLFLLLSSLLVSCSRSRGKLFGVQFLLTAILAMALLLANAVTGAVAVALLIIFVGQRVGDEKFSPPSRIGYLLTAIVFVVLFWLLSSGEAQFGWPHFSYGAVGDMMRFAPLMILLAAAIFLYSADSFLALSVAILSAFGLFTFFFAGRGIIVDNASRFFYHAGLVGFPLILPLVIRLWYWARREVFYTTRAGLHKLTPVLLVVVGIVTVLLPPLSSIAATLDHLLFQDEQTITNAMRESGWWIADHTQPSDVVLTSPYPPWFVPFLTGRTLLRSGQDDGSAYWLSADDMLFTQHIDAFNGDKEAQEDLVSHANYLLLSADDRSMWEPLPYEKVFDTGEMVIYKLK